MALMCSQCGSDQVQTLADRDKCLGCGAWLVHGTGEVSGPGLVWTSERPASVMEDGPTDDAPVTLKNQAGVKA